MPGDKIFILFFEGKDRSPLLFFLLLPLSSSISETLEPSRPSLPSFPSISVITLHPFRFHPRPPRYLCFTPPRESFIFRPAMAGKLLANLIVMGSTVLGRAFVQAYRQALANASKSGVAQETVNTMRRGSKYMTEAEARQILGVTAETPWEDIVKKYDNLFERNAKNGSFYLQSKVHRAKECLEAEQQGQGRGEGTSS